MTKARIEHRRLRLLGTGLALPGLPISSSDLLEKISSRFHVSTQLGRALSRRMGVVTRHMSRDWLDRLESPRPGARNPELATAALVDALAESRLSSRDLQYLFAHTTTPARLLPANAAEVADRIGLAAPYVELRQASSGFASALFLASGMLAQAGDAPVAIVGSEVGSVYCDPLALAVDPGQWINTVQMGDGAAAIILAPENRTDAAYVHSVFHGHIGLGRSPGFTLDEGGSDYPAVREGRAVATFHCEFERVKRDGPEMYAAAFSAAREAGIDLAAMTLIVPHQASGRSSGQIARALGLPPSRVFGNGDRLGNLGSASIWASLHELRHNGQLNAGDRVLFIGVEASHYMYGGFEYVHG